MGTNPDETREVNPKTCAETTKRASLSILRQYAVGLWKLECSLAAEIFLPQSIAGETRINT